MGPLFYLFLSPRSAFVGKTMPAAQAGVEGTCECSWDPNDKRLGGI